MMPQTMMVVFDVFAIGEFTSTLHGVQPTIAISRTLKLPARCSTIKDIHYYLTSSSVKEELKQTSKAKRSPIVLILDKVYSFINH